MSENEIKYRKSDSHTQDEKKLLEELDNKFFNDLVNGYHKALFSRGNC